MRSKKMMKSVVIAALVLSMALVMAACSASEETSTTAYKTVDGVTEGNNEVTTEDKGSASFDIEGNHVKMTNFEFDADPELKVQAEIVEEDLVYTQVNVHDGENTIQNIADAKYPETITEENKADVFNNIYKTVLGADDEPFTADSISEDTGVFVAQAELNDGNLVLLGKKDSNEFISLAFTTTEYGAQDITDAAFGALEN